jgi:choline dehydrogenase-like flavoprotein
VLSIFDAMAFPGALHPGAPVRGRGLGGSSAVNGMVAWMGPLEQYRAWGWDDVEEALARVRLPMQEAGGLGAVDRGGCCVRRTRREVPPFLTRARPRNAPRLRPASSATCDAYVRDGERGHA